MKRILDFIIIFLLVFLIVSVFTKKDETPVLTGGVTIKTDASSYTIPASIKLEVKNMTAESIAFNTCENIDLKTNGVAVDFTGSPICRDATLASGEVTTIDYATEYEKMGTAGEYYFQAKIGEAEPLSTFTVDHRGTISKIFIAFVYAPILNLMDWLIEITGHSLGWGILLITIIVRIVLLWPQHKMMLSQRKLQAIQPKIKKLQEEHKGNQQKMGMELMALYKKEKVNPMGSCGFLLIQMPILFVLYNVILEIRDPANMYYLYSGLQNFKISAIDSNFYGMELFATGMDRPVQGAILALFVGGVQYLQVKLSLGDKLKQATQKGAVLEKKKSGTGYESMMPDPDMMNKFMLYGMPAMVTVFTFSFFAGLGLYWGMSTVFMICQQLVVNKIAPAKKIKKEKNT